MVLMKELYDYPNNWFIINFSFVTTFPIHKQISTIFHNNYFLYFCCFKGKLLDSSFSRTGERFPFYFRKNERKIGKILFAIVNGSTLGGNQMKNGAPKKTYSQCNGSWLLKFDSLSLCHFHQLFGVLFGLIKFLLAEFKL